jgi:hypothetical protein
MKTQVMLKKIGLGLLVSSVALLNASAIVAYDSQSTVSSANIQNTGGPFILGNEFNVNSAISVTAIGAFDYLAGGFSSASPVQVAIYQLTGSTWNQVAGTAVTFNGPASSYSFVGYNAFSTLGSSVTLGDGTYAIVAANYGTAANPNWNRNLNLGTPANQGTTFQDGGGLISIPGGSESAFYSSGSTLAGTLSGLTVGNWGNPLPAFGAGTFDFTSLTPVPEVDTFAIASVSMLGLVFIGRNLVPRRRF